MLTVIPITAQMSIMQNKNINKNRTTNHQ